MIITLSKHTGVKLERKIIFWASLISALCLVPLQVYAQESGDLVVPPGLRAVLDLDFDLKDLSNKSIDTASTRGEIVLLNFWATWCAPCRDEIPILNALQTKYKKHLRVIGLIIDDDKDKAQTLARELGISYPVAIAPAKLLTAYGGIPAVPMSLIFDSKHRMVYRHVGIYAIPFYEPEIRLLLGLRHINRAPRRAAATRTGCRP